MLMTSVYIYVYYIKMYDYINLYYIVLSHIILYYIISIRIFIYLYAYILLYLYTCILIYLYTYTVLCSALRCSALLCCTVCMYVRMYGRCQYMSLLIRTRPSRRGSLLPLALGDGCI